MINCKNMKKSFGRQTVIESLSYEFNDSGFYLLFGESGSGKTTFLNLLAGFLPFEGGSVDWNEKNYEYQVDKDEVGEEFDYITQDPFFVDFLTVYENLELICDDKALIMRTLSRFGMGEKALQYPPTLSGGEKQRLALARAVMKGKRVLFLDEPTASLDAENKTSVFRLLRELSESMLIICSSHDAQAKNYADEIICFTKSEKISDTISEKPSAKPRKKMSEGKAPPMKYLKKYFKARRKIYLSILYSVFLIFSICMCVLADTPDNKTDSALEHIYGINMVSVNTTNGLTWSDICPEGDERVRQVVMSYGSCPTSTDKPNESGLFEMLYDDIDVIPSDKDVFGISDRLKYGTWFENKYEVLLSAQVADLLSPGEHEKLLGTKISCDLYGYGDTEFEIVGIFDYFTEIDCAYLRSAGISISYKDQFIPFEGVTSDLFGMGVSFFSSELTEVFEENENCFRGSSKQRTYYVYFDNFRDMKSFYDDMGNMENVWLSYSDAAHDMRMLFIILIRVLLPMSVFLALFSAMFYIELKKTEFVYNSAFISVFEYSGYTKKKTVSRFILLNILQYLKVFAVSSAIALAMTYAVNLINSLYHFASFQIFTYNIWMIAGFLSFNIILILIFTNIFFRKVKVRSWYENLIAQRDLI